MRYFGGLSEEEVADALEVSLPTLAAGDAIVFARVQALIVADERVDTGHFMLGAVLFEVEQMREDEPAHAGGAALTRPSMRRSSRSRIGP